MALDPAAHWCLTPDLADRAAQVISSYAAAGRTVALAESCTGGLIAGALTAIAGSSAVVLGGVVSYANSAKTGLLGVPAVVIDRRGAVSAEVATAMAEGARTRLGSDVALAVTGIAGPGGGSAAKPVGLVWFALATKGGTQSWSHLFPGGRDAIRHATVAEALATLVGAVGATS